MRGTFGLDGWTSQHLALLPLVWWEAAAHMLEDIEQGADWLEQMCIASVPLTPKSASTKPLDQRPITVLPVLYRVWAAHRAQDLRGWQEAWPDPFPRWGVLRNGKPYKPRWK